MRPGVKITRDEQIVNLERSVFQQMRSALPVNIEKEKPLEYSIREVSFEDAIKELIELEKLNVLHQEYQQ